MSPYEEYRPDWAFWRVLPAVELWEAVALSLNIEPRVLMAHPAGGGSAGVAVSLIHPQELYERFDLARRCLGGETLPAVEILSGSKPKVTLETFARWAVDVNWPLPEGLVALAAERGQNNDNVAQRVPYRTGLPGKPTSWHLIEAECRSRYSNGERHPTTNEWARVLIAWLSTQHPAAPLVTVKTLSNKLSPLLRQLQASRSK